MFVYEFKSSECLITKIVISGLHLTIYTKKPNSAELNGIIKEFNLNSHVSGDHPKHVFCHNNYLSFSAKGDSIPHKHLRFNNISSIVEIPAQITAFINKLNAAQDDHSTREAEHVAFFNRIDDERKSYGHAEFPLYIQEALKNYDTQSPYIAPLERKDFLNALNSYYNQEFNIKQNELVQYTEQFFSDHFDLIYTKWTIGFVDEKSMNEEEQNTMNYYHSLMGLRDMLLKLNIRYHDYHIHYHAIDYIDKLRKNKHFNIRQPFSSVISDIENCLSKKQQALICQSVAASVAIPISLIALFILILDLRHEKKLFTASLTTAIICGVGTAYLAKPVYATVMQTFFDYLTFEDSQKPDSTKPDLHIYPQY